MAIGAGQLASRVNFSFDEFSEVRIAPVQPPRDPGWRRFRLCRSSCA
jgi:hypothetical protein